MVMVDPEDWIEVFSPESVAVVEGLRLAQSICRKIAHDAEHGGGYVSGSAIDVRVSCTDEELAYLRGLANG